MSELEVISNRIQSIFASASGQTVAYGDPGYTSDDFLELISTSYKIVQIDGDIDQSELDLGLNIDFLTAAREGFVHYARNLLEKLDEPETPALDHPVSARTRVNSIALERGYKPLLDPFTGKLHESFDCLGREWYFIRSGSDYCFVSELSQPMTFMGVEGLWVFPARKLILWFNNGYGVDDIKRHVAAFYSSMSRNADGVTGYLASKERIVGLTDFHCPHVCHNFWNVMTGWSNVLQREASPVSLIVQYDNQNFYGLVQDLFSDKVRSEACFVANDEDAFLKLILEHKALLYCVKDEFISNHFTSRVLKHAYGKVSSEFMNEVRAFREQVNPFILVTIRLDNRAWVEQTSGFINVLAKLQTKYPRLGVMIDGLSSDSVKGWTTGWMSLDAELQVARDIRSGLEGKVPTIFGVGRTFFESIVLSDMVDAFIAPIGSGMTIYKWISNKPGVAISNRTALDPVRIWQPLRVWDHYCQTIDPAYYVPLSIVADVEDARDHVSRANFTMNWIDLFQHVELFLSEILPNFEKN